MQQLYLIAKQRYNNLKKIEINPMHLNTEILKQMREDEKLRCEKQSWILSIFRAKKSKITPQLKKTYFQYSQQIMKIIEPNFQTNNRSQKNSNSAIDDSNNYENTDQNFLNTFVCLYTKFFEQYQHKLNFKLKVKSLLRPTNHNVINDLIKYLVDFSRDYCQYLIFLKIKVNDQKIKNSQRQKQKQKKKCIKQSNQELQLQQQYSDKTKSIAYEKNNVLQGLRNSLDIVDSTKYAKHESINGQHNPKRVPVSSLSTHIITTATGEDQGSPTYNQLPTNIKKQQLQKLYSSLDIQNLQPFVYTEKTKISIDILKLKMNEMYRDIKYRNNFIKQSLQEYHNKYFPNFATTHGSNQFVFEDTSQISSPYKVSLIIEKNGFSCISLSLVNQKLDRNLSPLKDSKNRSSSFSQREGLGISNNFRTTLKSQYLLNSLKVIRVSQNILPPLQTNITTQNNAKINKFSKKSIHLPYQYDNPQLMKNKRQRMHSISSALDKQIIRLQKLDNQPESTNMMVQSTKNKNEVQGSKNGPIYYSYNNSYNQQVLREAERKKQQKKKISDMRRHFTSDQKFKNSKKKVNDPQQKIVQWLDKINLMKQLERKKIMGLS